MGELLFEGPRGLARELNTPGGLIPWHLQLYTLS